MSRECHRCKSEITPEDRQNGWYFVRDGKTFCSATCFNLWEIEKGGESNAFFDFCNRANAATTGAG